MPLSDRYPTESKHDNEFDAMAFVEDHRWTFAKTMANIPHEYVVRGREGCRAEAWDRMADYIKQHGYWAAWSPPGAKWRKVNKYLDLAGYRYWVIYPIVNREVLGPSSTTTPLSPEEAEKFEKKSKTVPPEIWAHREAW